MTCRIPSWAAHRPRGWCSWSVIHTDCWTTRKEKILSGRGLNASYRCRLLPESKNDLVTAWCGIRMVGSALSEWCTPLRGVWDSLSWELRAWVEDMVWTEIGTHTKRVCVLQNLDQWTMRQSSLELQLMIKQTANNVSFCSVRPCRDGCCQHWSGCWWGGRLVAWQKWE